MNRPLLITIGIVVLLFMLGLWGYLLAYGAPEKPREVFANLGFLSSGENEVRVVDPYTIENPSVELALGGSVLQQLTTRAVAGFIFVLEPAKTLRYAERGTGHIFEINLETGSEQQISVTTVPQTAEAVFSPSGTHVVLTTYEGYSRASVLGTLESESTLSLASLPEDAYNIVFEDEDTVYFTIDEGGESVGYSLDTATLSRTQNMRIPFVSARALWGSGVDGIYVFPKPSSVQEGGVYQVGSSLLPVGEAGRGLTGFAFANRVVSSFVQNNTYVNAGYIDGKKYNLTLTMLPEKCVSSPVAPDKTWCAAPLGKPSVSYVEDWYKGTIVNKDYVWVTDFIDGSSQMAVDLTELSGRTIDVDGITINTDGTLLLFRNKIDGALWLYRILQ